MKHNTTEASCHNKFPGGNIDSGLIDLRTSKSKYHQILSSHKELLFSGRTNLQSFAVLEINHHNIKQNTHSHKY